MGVVGSGVGRWIMSRLETRRSGAKRGLGCGESDENEVVKLFL